MLRSKLPLAVDSARFDSLFLLEQFGQRLLRADVMHFHPSQLLLCLHAGGDCHETVEAARVEAAVVVLGAAIHWTLGPLQISNDIRPHRISLA